jgi:hypothetical protein
MSSTPSSLDYPKMNMPLPIAIVLAFMLLIGIALLFHIGITCNDTLHISISKDKLNPSRWLKNKYRFYVANQVLPTLHIKEKKSPILDSDPVSPILAKCPKLDSAEKGKNVMFHRLARHSDIEITTNETKITISANSV